MYLYIMRHGQTDWNVEKRLQGAADIPLNETGRAEARQAAERLKEIPFDLILTSPLSRARETAQLVRGGRNIPIRTEPRLREMSFGNCEGKTAAECPLITTFFQDPTHYIPDGGESYAQVLSRCRALFRETLLPLEETCEHVLLCTHGAFSRALFCAAENRPLSQFWLGPPQPNCSVRTLRVEKGRIGVK